MKVIDNEQNEKREGQFLKIEDKSKIILKSKLVLFETAYPSDDVKTILWDDRLNEKGVAKRKEYIYWGSIDGQEGIIRVPASIFFSMNEAERVADMDKRDVEWIVSKSGQGKQTRYTIIRGKDAKSTKEVIDANTEKLMKVMVAYEAKLKEKLEDYLKHGSFTDGLSEEQKHLG